MKFSTKLIVLGASIFLTASSVAIYVADQASRKIVEAQIKSRIESQAFHTMDKIDRMIYERSRDIMLLATDPVIKSGASTRQQITARLKEYQKRYSSYSSLSLFTLDRMRIADTSGVGIGRPHQFNEYWHDIAAGKEFVVNVYKSTTSNSIDVYFAQVVKDENGVPFGVVVARMPVDSLYEITKQAQGIIGEAASLKIDLVDRSGLLIYSNHNTAGILKDVLPDFKMIQQTAGSVKGSAIHHHQGEEKTLSIFVHEQGFLDFSGNGWTLLAHVPAKAIFAPAREVRNRLLIVHSIFFVITLIVILLFSRTFARPLVELSSVTDAIGKGNFDIRAQVRSRDEFGALASAFNTMAKELKDSHVALRAYSTELEKQVEERTDRLMLERAKRECDEQLFREQKEQSIATLAGGMAHDFNNILMSVMGSAHLLRMKLPSSAKERELAQSIISSSERMADLTRQLLAYAKKGMYESAAVSLNAVVREALTLTHRGKASENEVTLNLSEDLWLVRADPGQMKQVLINLFTNAFEAMEQGAGRLAVRTVNVYRDVWKCHALERMHPAGEYVFVAVSDTGHGIPVDIRQRIFEPFFTTKFLGRGLGLAAAAGIIQNHGGCISFESTEGKGTSFYFYLPCAAAEERKVPEAILQAPKAVQPGTILLVDDEPMILSSIGQMLTEMGHVVLSAGSGKEALGIFMNGMDAIRLAILDVQMPDMDGKELFDELKSHKSDLKVLMSSGFDEQAALSGMGVLRPEGFIQKPYQSAALRKKIAEILTR